MTLPSLRSGLLTEPLLDQVLVYDTADDKLHLLDETTAKVYDLLDKGENRNAIVAKLEGSQGSENGAALLALALDELAKARLLNDPKKIAPEISDVTRRQMIQRFAGIGAAVLIPAIVSLTPSPVYAQASGVCGQACSTAGGCAAVPGGCNCCSKGKGGFTANTCTTQPNLPADCLTTG